MEAEGMDGHIVADGTGLTLTFRGLSCHRDKKAASPRQFDWGSIASVTFTERHGLTTAFLRVNLIGEPTTTKKPNRDLNVLLANTLKQQEQVRLFAEQVNSRLSERAGTSPVAAAPGDQRQSVDAASDRMLVKFGARRELRKLARHHLVPGEQARYTAAGRVRNHNGLLVMTDRRLIFVFHGRLRQSIEDIPLDNITSVRERTGLVLGSLTVLASSTELVIANVGKPDLKVVASALRSRITTGSLPPLPAIDLDAEDESDADPPIEIDDSVDVLAQLRQLGELRDAGVLTDAEFESAKAALLGRL